MAVNFFYNSYYYLNFGIPSQYVVSTNMSISTWINPQESTYTQGRMIAQRWFNSTGGLVRTWMFYIPPTGYPQFNIYNSVVSTTALLTANAWTLVTGTYDGSTLKIYLNGVLNNSQSYTGTISNNSTAVLHVGANPGSILLRSSLFDFRIWNTTLSADAIWDMYANPGRDSQFSGMVIRTCINNGYVGSSLSGQTVYDHSIYKNSVSPNGAPTVTADPYSTVKSAIRLPTV